MNADARARLARAMTEDELLIAITEAATFLGWRWHHVRRSDLAVGMGHTGFPDLVLAKRGRVLFLELKRQDGKTTADQDAWIDELSGGGMRALSGAGGWVDALVVHPAMLDTILAELGARPSNAAEDELIRAKGGDPGEIDRLLRRR